MPLQREKHPKQPRNPASTQDRRTFLRTAASLTASGVAVGAIGGLVPPRVNASRPEPLSETAHALGDAEKRAEKSLEIKRNSALRNRNEPLPHHADNGDEDRHPNRIANFTKGLPHNEIGVVAVPAYDTLLNAIRSGKPGIFETIPLGGTVRLVNPQAGLAFDLEGMDSHQTVLKPPPPFASAERASEAVECYWMSLLRDVNFSAYRKSDAVLVACKELSGLSDFRGPKVSGRVTPETLFRGFTHGDSVGPFISQFLLHTLDYGALHVPQKIDTYLPRTDHLTDLDSWLAVQNGHGPLAVSRIDPRPRHIRNGRDLSAYVHADQAYQAFFNATLFFAHGKLPANPGSPYRTLKTQAAFATFGIPHMQAMLGVVSGCALRAVWYHKWFVHRTLRPEEFGGRLHFTLVNQMNYPIHRDVLNSRAVAKVQSERGTCLLPQAFPEGCPQHPSYAQGHATVAGACATLLKAFLDEKHPLEHLLEIAEPSEDGLRLESYEGTDATQMTIGSELDKLAGNIAAGRNFAGIHWRSDYVEGLLLGEAVAIAVLRDQRQTFSEDFHGLTFTKFDGNVVTV